MANIKIVCLVFVALFCGIALSTPLLGAEKCTWGPSYWCNNITNAKGCSAVKHCIKAVWEKQTYPVDDDEICKICTDMVTQARDQLESNQTQEDLKAVFEGSCKLIPIEIVSNECISLVDQFIPELIETLASQMNPQVVCSVAGLCNNARIDQLLLEFHKNKNVQVSNVRAPVSTQKCVGCYTVIDLMKDRFSKMSHEEFLESTMRVCFKLGSYSDACAANLFKYFEDIYAHVKDNFNSENVCHVAGTCAERFHQHEDQGTTNVQITPMGDVGMLSLKDDTVPCQLCEQLVVHLRDIFIANTTEEEFKRVLEGLCKQTGSFKGECIALVDEYYPTVYRFLIGELNPNEVCFLAGLCRKGAEEDIPMAPLVPRESAALVVKIIKPTTERIAGNDEVQKPRVKIGDQSQSSVRVMQPELIQLPVDRMVLKLPQNKELCTFCQYFLHFLQVEISDAKTEEKIKQTVEKACDKLPSTINTECKGFVEAYGNAVIALLVEQIDPSQVCPMLTLCPKEEAVTNVEILMRSGNTDKPSCPLCLFAVEQLDSMLNNNRTVENIKHALDNLCSHLPAKLKNECVDFVDTYSKELLEMIIADFTPQEVCVYLKLCNDNRPDVSSLHKVSLIDEFHSKKMMADHNNFKHSLLPKEMLVESHVQIDTNEIPDNTYNGKPLSLEKDIRDSSAQCVICEFIMSQIDKQLHDKATDDEIKKIVHEICGFLPHDVATECNNFVDKYADSIIALLVNDLAPSEVCGALDMCNNSKNKLKNSVLECAVCEESIDIVERILSNPNVDRRVAHVVEKTCYALPARYLDRCKRMMDTYAESIIHLVSTLADSGKVCSKIGLCGADNYSRVKLTRTTRSAERLVGDNKCVWGPSYWCQTLEKAKECNALNHCKERVWKAETPKKPVRELLGAKKCTWGPSYWCENEDQANECHAIQHCRERVWFSESPRAKRSTQNLVGTKKCSWGPSYWCDNMDKAVECKAVQHCRERVWLADAPPPKKLN